MSRTARVIGAGLAGLSAAVALTRVGFAVQLTDSAAQAGGRCRSYHDPQLGCVIDNGNHLVLSGNTAVMRYLDTIGAHDRLRGPPTADFPFVDLASGERWRFCPNDGPLPWWVLARNRRVPGSRARDYLPFARLLGGRAEQTVADRTAMQGPVWTRLLEPVLVAALNTAPAEASAALTAAVIRQSVARGGHAMRPRVAEPTLSAAFVDPAVSWLKGRGGTVSLGERLRAIHSDGDRVTALELGDGLVEIAPDEPVVLAVPAWVAQSLLPGLVVPTEHRAIVNAHFAYAPPAGVPPMIGVIGGTAEWIFAFEDRLSVTVSAADHLIDTDRETLAHTFWSEIAAVHGLPSELPRWQIVKEKRATFAATPAQDALRPGAATRHSNLFLAGDWTQTGLPSTIEGAVRSGDTAARLAAALSMR